MGLLAERENAFGQVIILLALPETIVLLGFIIGFLLLGKIESAECPHAESPKRQLT